MGLLSMSIEEVIAAAMDDAEDGLSSWWCQPKDKGNAEMQLGELEDLLRAQDTIDNGQWSYREKAIWYRAALTSEFHEVWLLNEYRDLNKPSDDTN